MLTRCPNGLIFAGTGQQGLTGLCDYPHRTECNSGLEPHNDCKCNYLQLRAFYGRSAGALRALCGRSAGALRALCGRSAGALRALCGHSAGALRALCGLSAGALRALCGRSAGAPRALCSRSASALRALCSRSAGALCPNGLVWVSKTGASQTDVTTPGATPASVEARTWQPCRISAAWQHIINILCPCRVGPWAPSNTSAGALRALCGRSAA
jgi:hypothetical protein